MFAKPQAMSSCRSTAAAEGLAFLAAHLFFFVAHTLALVWFGWLGSADLGGVLTDLLLVSTANDNQRSRVAGLELFALGIAHLDRDAFGRRHYNLVRKAD